MNALQRRGDFVGIGSELLQQPDARIEGDHGRFALIADHDRLDHPADFLNLWQHGFHAIVGFDRDRQGDQREGHVHVNVLLFAVVEEMELLRSQAIDVVAMAVHHGYRGHHHFHRDPDRPVYGHLGFGGVLLALGEQAGREQPGKYPSHSWHEIPDVTSFQNVAHPDAPCGLPAGRVGGALTPR